MLRDGSTRLRGLAFLLHIGLARPGCACTALRPPPPAPSRLPVLAPLPTRSPPARPTWLGVLAVLVHVGAAGLRQDDVVPEVSDLHELVVKHLLRPGGRGGGSAGGGSAGGAARRGAARRAAGRATGRAGWPASGRTAAWSMHQVRGGAGGAAAALFRGQAAPGSACRLPPAQQRPLLHARPPAKHLLARLACDVVLLLREAVQDDAAARLAAGGGTQPRAECPDVGLACMVEAPVEAVVARGPVLVARDFRLALAGGWGGVAEGGVGCKK
jgi:hypothetical protein